MHPKRKPVFSKKQYQRVHFVSFLHSFEGYLETLFTVSWRSNQGYVVIGSCGNDDWAVSRAADCTLLVLEMDAEFDEGCQQTRRLHPDDNEDGGEGGGDKGS